MSEPNTDFYYVINTKLPPPGYVQCWSATSAFPTKITQSEADKRNTQLPPNLRWMNQQQVIAALGINFDSSTNYNCRFNHHLHHVCMTCGLIG